MLFFLLLFKYCCGNFVVKALMPALVVVVAKVLFQADIALLPVPIGVKIHFFILYAAPEPLDKDVVQRPFIK